MSQVSSVLLRCFTCLVMWGCCAWTAQRMARISLSFLIARACSLELDQNTEVWDVVYRQRLCDGDTKQVALEAQARLLRRVDEENVEKWKNKMKKVLSEEK